MWGVWRERSKNIGPVEYRERAGESKQRSRYVDVLGLGMSFYLMGSHSLFILPSFYCLYLAWASSEAGRKSGNMNTYGDADE